MWQNNPKKIDVYLQQVAKIEKETNLMWWWNIICRLNSDTYLNSWKGLLCLVRVRVPLPSVCLTVGTWSLLHPLALSLICSWLPDSLKDYKEEINYLQSQLNLLPCSYIWYMNILYFKCWTRCVKKNAKISIAFCS